jgi:Fic family protein
VRPHASDQQRQQRHARAASQNQNPTFLHCADWRLDGGLAAIEHRPGDLDITNWLQWSVAGVEQACDEARMCIERVVAVAQFWTRHREAPINARQRRLLEVARAPNDAADAWLTAKRAATLTKVERVTASRGLSRL